MESYDIKDLPISYNREIKISFCAAILNISESVKRSVESIVNVAEEMGYPYELVISTHSSVNFISDRVKFITENFSTYGAGKQLAYLRSTGDYIVIFNPDTVYTSEISDVIHSFLEKREKRALVCNLIVVARDLLDKTGGWRNLRKYEDIDLLARIAGEGGITAFPSDYYDSLKYGNDGRKSIPEVIRDFRDAIISCNFSLRDIGIVHLEPFYISYISFMLSKLSRTKPFKFKENNRIIVMESIIESLILKDYENYLIPDNIPKLKLTHDEIKYMEKRSYLWNKINKSIMEIIEDSGN
jgi:hypothetical protein